MNLDPEPRYDAVYTEAMHSILKEERDGYEADAVKLAALLAEARSRLDGFREGVRIGMEYTRRELADSRWALAECDRLTAALEVIRRICTEENEHADGRIAKIVNDALRIQPTN